MDYVEFDSKLAKKYYKRINKADDTIGESLFTSVLWRFNDKLVIVRSHHGYVDAKRYESLEALDAKWTEAIGWVEEQMPDEAEMAFLEEALTEMCEAWGTEISED